VGGSGAGGEAVAKGRPAKGVLRASGPPPSTAADLVSGDVLARHRAQADLQRRHLLHSYLDQSRAKPSRAPREGTRRTPVVAPADTQVNARGEEGAGGDKRVVIAVQPAREKDDAQGGNEQKPDTSRTDFIKSMRLSRSQSDPNFEASNTATT